MSLDITNFFKILWNDEDLNNKPTSTTSNTTNVVSEGNNGNDVLPTPIMPHNADNADTNPSFVCPDLDKLSDSSRTALSYTYNDLSEGEKFEQYDPDAKVYVNYTTRMELTHDFLVQNPWVVDALSGKVSDEITMVKIEYVSSSDICPEYDSQEYVVNAATMDLLGKEMCLVNCDGKETLLALTSAEMRPDTLDISFQGVSEEGNWHDLDVEYILG